MQSVNVVAAIVLRDGKALLMKSTRHDRIVVPGGKPKPGETDEQAVVREVLEESGLRVLNVGPRLGTEQRGQFAVHFYRTEVEDGEPVASSDAASMWWGGPSEYFDRAWIELAARQERG